MVFSCSETWAFSCTVRKSAIVFICICKFSLHSTGLDVSFYLAFEIPLSPNLVCVGETLISLYTVAIFLVAAAFRQCNKPLLES